MSEDEDDDARAERLLRARAKQVMRQRMRTVRRALPQSAAAARSQALCERLVALPAFAGARTIVGYVALGREADPAQALEHARRNGTRVGLVRVDVEDGEQTLGARLHEPDAALEQNAMGVLQPLATAPRLAAAEIDLIIVPALGLDERGYRLGYGGGFYDRFLPALPNARRVAIAYDFQLLFEIPNAPHDVPVHVVVTDKRVVQV